MDFFLFLFLHPSSFCLETPLWIRDSPLFRFLVAVSWGRGVLYLSAISIIISTFIRLHSLRSSDHFWALPASNVHLPAFTAVFVLHSLSRLPPPLPRSVQHFPTSVTGAWTLPLSVLDDLHLRGCRIWTRDLCHCSLALYHLSHPSPNINEIFYSYFGFKISWWWPILLYVSGGVACWCHGGQHPGARG